MSVYGSEQLAASFRTVRMNTLQAAREIPAERYGFSPVEGFMTVEKLLTHIALAPDFQYQVHAVERLSDMADFDWKSHMAEAQRQHEEARDKSEVVALLEESGERWAGFLDGVSDEFLAETVSFPAEWGQPPKSRFEMLLSVKEHEMHHRGQLMLTQRLIGIVPHLTRRREERMQGLAESGKD